jgi:hypothetical protein
MFASFHRLQLSVDRDTKVHHRFYMLELLHILLLFERLRLLVPIEVSKLQFPKENKLELPQQKNGLALVN